MTSNIFKSINYNQLIEILLGFYIFTFCVSTKLSNFILILLLIFVIYGILINKIKFSFKLVNLLFVFFYLLYAIGVFYTKNKSLSFFYLENKFSFIFFPFIFSFLRDFHLNINRLNNILIIGVLTLAIMGIVNGFHCSIYNLSKHCFFTTSFSFIHHPSYFLVFNCVSFCFLALQYFQSKIISFYKVISYLVVSFGIHILSLSLAGILFFAFVVTFFSIYFFYSKFNRPIFYISIVLMVLLSIFTATKVRILNNELRGASKYILVYTHSPTDFVASRKSDMSGSEVRLVMWTVTFLEIKEHPWGVGTGNVDFYLRKRLRLLNQPDLAKYNYNPHNQFLQTTLEIGVVGLFLLLGLIIHISYLAWKQKNWILLILATNLFFNSLFESMLQRQSGIVFYCFWIVLLLSFIPSTKKLKI